MAMCAATLITRAIYPDVGAPHPPWLHPAKHACIVDACMTILHQLPEVTTDILGHFKRSCGMTGSGSAKQQGGSNLMAGLIKLAGPGPVVD
jgi:hypothetical protein